MTTSEKMVAAWWGFLGLVITATVLPIAIATSNGLAWLGLGAGVILVGLSTLSLVTGRAIFGDGTPWGGVGGRRK